MRAMLDRLFAGRNGVDQLNIALLYWQFYFGWLRFFLLPTAFRGCSMGSACWRGILHCAGAFEKPWTTAAGEPEVFELVPWRARWS